MFRGLLCAQTQGGFGGTKLVPLDKPAVETKDEKLFFPRARSLQYA